MHFFSWTIPEWLKEPPEKLKAGIRTEEHLLCCDLSVSVELTTEPCYTIRETEAK